MLANTGTGYSHQWQLNGVDISGATNATYNATVAGNYSVNIVSPCGNASSAATVVDITALSATASPSAITICEGQATTFTANTGYSYAYQWFRNNVLINGATNSTFATSQAATYKVRITQGGVCSATSGNAILTVTNNPKPTVTAGGPTTFCAGQNVTLTANTFSGVGYQWQKGSANIAGATNQNYIGTTTGAYRVVETANGCTKISSAIAVTVNCREENTTSVDLNNSQISLVPNPTSGKVKIKLTTNGDDKIVLRVLSVLGNEVLFENFQVKEGENVRELNLQHFANGIYFIEVISRIGNNTFKLVKQ